MTEAATTRAPWRDVYSKSNQAEAENRQGPEETVRGDFRAGVRGFA